MTPIKGFTPPHELSGLPKSTPILVAFSGGPDSAALLRMLVEYGKESGTPIYAAHVDHLIRDGEHERDRDFCVKMAQGYGVEIFVKTVDIPALSEKTGESLELCARRARYEFFDELMQKLNIPLLATAHNADDNLETLLMSLVRGSGLHGMCGIPPSRKTTFGTLIRPLLAVSKNDILDYCQKSSIEFVTDSTNALPDCTRNRLRLEVLPILKEINGSAVANASRLSALCREDDALLSSMADDLVKDGSIYLERFNSSPAPIGARALFKLFGGELERVHIEALTQLCRKAVPHSELSLPEGKTAVIENGALTSKAEAPPVLRYEIPLLQGENRIADRHLLYVSAEDTIIYNYETKVAVASDKIVGELVARSRREGDTILLRGHHRSVKKLMNEKKLDLALRESLPLICDDNGILFIPYIGARDGIVAKNSESKIYITLM